MLKKVFSKLKNVFQKIKKFCIKHKKTSIIIGLVLVFVIYKIVTALVSTDGEVRYITSNVYKGTLVASVSGSGQVSASNQIDIKSKVSGDVQYVGAKSGQSVGTGFLIMSLDSGDIAKSVRDAEINLQNAKLALEKLKLQNSDENMNADLAKAYDDGYTAVSDAFLDLPSTVTGIDDILAEENVSDNKARNSGNTALDYKAQAEKLYYESKNIFEKNRTKFRLLDRNSPKTDIEMIIDETYLTAKIVADALKSTRNLVDFLAEDTGRTSEYSASISSLSTYTNTVNGHLSNLLSIKTSIKNYKDAFPSTNLDIQSSELAVKQKENALQDAKDNLSDYYIRAPFGGIVAKLLVKKLDSISAGTIVATFITNQKIAELSLNEIDIAKIKVDQKAMLTFDAVSDLQIEGTIVELDTVGTVDQGVVTYMVKIGFDINDERVKPGMSVSASIITDTVLDALYVPNSAVKQDRDNYYVEVFENPLAISEPKSMGMLSDILPLKKQVQIGLVNDTHTQIISGLNEGDQVVSRVITSSTKAPAQTAPSLFGSPSGNRVNGGANRAGSTR